MATLKTLETELEKEVQRFENSAINIGKLLNQIKESGAFEEAGYRYFQPYYRERWEERIGRTWKTAKTYMYRSKIVEEMEGVDDHHHPVTDTRAAHMLGAIEDPADRVKVYNEHVESGEPRAGYKNLDRRIREHKVDPEKSINDNLRDAGVDVPDDGGSGSTVGDKLTPKGYVSLPPGKLSPAQELHYQIGPMRIKSREVTPRSAADALSDPAMLDSHIEAAEEFAGWLTQYADVLKAKKRGRLSLVGGDS